jgi:hypothetical protein
MTIIQVGSTITEYGSNGEVASVLEKPSYLIQEDGTKVALTNEEAKKHGIGRDSKLHETDERTVDFAKLEAMMFRQLEIKHTRAALLEESQLNDTKIRQMLREANMNQHIAKYDENYELKATIVEDRQKMFDKDQMAKDLGVEPSATGRKDFLINMTEKGKLTLDKFKEYFYYEPTVKLSLKKVKLKKGRQKKQR